MFIYATASLNASIAAVLTTEIHQTICKLIVQLFYEKYFTQDSSFSSCDINDNIFEFHQIVWRWFKNERILCLWDCLHGEGMEIFSENKVCLLEFKIWCPPENTHIDWPIDGITHQVIDRLGSIIKFPESLHTYRVSSVNHQNKTNSKIHDMFCRNKVKICEK